MSDELLDLIEDAVFRRQGQPEGHEILFVCPTHDDHHPSARWSGAKATWYCDACGKGGGALDLAARLGIELPTQQGDGLSLADLAAAKGLSVSFLRSLGVTEGVNGTERIKCADIPYLTTSGEAGPLRRRISLSGRPRFLWRRGDKPIPYGLWRLAEWTDRSCLILVEGESDTWTLWIAGFAALGIPGASNWKEAWKNHVQGFDSVFVWREADAGGDALAPAIAADLPDVRIIEAPADAKDPSEMWLACGSDVAKFRVMLEDLLSKARPASELRTEALGEEARTLLQRCRQLLESPTLVTQVQEAIHANGYAGDLTPPTLVWIAMISRHLERPLNLGVIAQSSAGKNRAVDEGLALVNPEAYHLEKAGSARAVIYTEGSFAHRMIVFAEADSIPEDGPAASAIRSLAADSFMSYDVVEKDAKSGQFVTRRIEKPGPTGLITTSTKHLGEQMSTRLLTVSVLDTPGQTRAVLLAHAANVNGSRSAPDLSTFIALDRWLEIAGEHRVVIPFAEALAHAVPTTLVRMRRDFRQLLTVIQTLALIHQRQRQRDEAGRVIASFDDYSIARELLLDLFSATASGGVTAVVRDTVLAVASLTDGAIGVTAKDVGEKQGVAKDTAWHRVKRALALGYLTNLETRRGQPARLVLGDPLPEASVALPTVEELMHRCVIQPEPDSTVQPTVEPRVHAEAEEPVERTIERPFQPDIQPVPDQAADSDKPLDPPPVERLNPFPADQHTSDHDPMERTYAFILAEALGFPALSLRPGISIVEGRECWEKFSKTCSPELLALALAKLELHKNPTERDET